MKYTLIWEDSFVSGVCQFKEFDNFEHMYKYISPHFKVEALWNVRAINDTETIWFIDKKWNND